MDSVLWETDTTYSDCLGNRIRFLRRTLADLESAKARELLPFFNEMSSFVLECYRPEHSKERVRGRLLRLDLEPDVVRARVLSHTSKEVYVWVIHELARTLLTVWRLNDPLEAVQIDLAGSESSLHMQTGGERLLLLYDNQGRGLGWDKELAREVQAFSENTVFS